MCHSSHTYRHRSAAEATGSAVCRARTPGARSRECSGTIGRVATPHRMHRTRMDDVVIRLVYLRTRGLLGRAVRLLLFVLGIDIPRTVPIGPGLTLVHATAGLVVHPDARIGRDVTILHGVTLGRADPWVPLQRGPMDLVISDGVVLGTGAVVLARSGETLTIGAGAIIGANAVVTQSVGPGETWAGNPARRVSPAARTVG
jgi:serine O-acetyltransferase